MSKMNERERSVKAARRHISDARLVAFFRAAEKPEPGGIIAVKLICRALNEGKGLDEIFYDGDDFGFTLSVVRRSESVFKITFGCSAGPLAGDGGEWIVAFNGDEVKTLQSVLAWDV